MIEDAVLAQRLCTRKPVYLPARIQSEGTKSLGVLQDISKYGGRLFVMRSFPVDGEIRVTLGEGIERNCIVRRCVAVPNIHKFDLGFEVIEGPWPDSILPAEGSEDETVHP
jgi:hypothetical protein